MRSSKAVILGSGKGSNARAILSFARERRDLKIMGVFSDQTQAGIQSVAEEFSVPYFCFPVLNKDKASQERQIIEKIRELAAEWIFLAGYMRLLSKEFVENHFDVFLGTTRIVNIHPSLLPAFKGLDGYGDAFLYGSPMSGVTVHFVTPELDAGPIILQKSFLRYPEDSLEDFKKRGLALEHELYPEAIKLLLDNRLVLKPIAGSSRPLVVIREEVKPWN